MRKPIVIASAVIFIYGMLASMLGTIVPGLGGRLALTNVELSYLALAQGVGLAATSVWAGALMDRSGCESITETVREMSHETVIVRSC